MTTKTLSSNVNNDILNVSPTDIYLDAEGNISISYDKEAVLEACAQAARTLLGEMIFDTETGIPFFQTVWVGKPNIQQYTAALRSAFLAVAGGNVVTDVTSLITSQNEDILYYSAVIKTIYGIGTITGSTENG